MGAIEGRRDVTHCRAWSIGNDGRHLGRVTSAIALVDVLNHFLTATRLDVDVNIRRAITSRGQESFKKEVEPHRIGVGNAQRITRRRVGGRATSLTQNVAPPTELRDVPDDEEVTGKAHLLNDGQFVINLAPRATDELALSRAVSARRPRLDQLAQILLLTLTAWRGEIGQ